MSDQDPVEVALGASVWGCGCSIAIMVICLIACAVAITIKAIQWLF